MQQLSPVGIFQKGDCAQFLEIAASSGHQRHSKVADLVTLLEESANTLRSAYGSLRTSPNRERHCGCVSGGPHKHTTMLPQCQLCVGRSERVSIKSARITPAIDEVLEGVRSRLLEKLSQMTAQPVCTQLWHPSLLKAFDDHIFRIPTSPLIFDYSFCSSFNLNPNFSLSSSPCPSFRFQHAATFCIVSQCW